MKRLIWLLLLTPCFAQIQGNLPNALDCQQDRAGAATPGIFTWQENIAIGDTIVLGFDTDATSTYSIADSLGNTWTSTSATQTPAPQPTGNVWMAYTQSAFNGSDTITLTKTGGPGTFFFMLGCRFTGLGAIDGTVATQTSSATGLSTISTTNTTTNNNDILVNMVGNGPFGNSTASPSNTEAPNFEPNAGPPVIVLMTYLHAGVAGSITSTEKTYSQAGATFAMQTLAFKPSSLRIADVTPLPDAGVGIAYSAQLHGIGGIAGLTYACTGLPANGLSLNTATGVISGANPTAGTLSLGCTATDGSTTSATDTLALKIGTLQVPSIRQTQTFSADSSALFSMNVRCGSSIVLVVRGDDTHAGQGWMQTTNGTNNYWKDSFGSPVRRIDSPVPGNTAWPLVTYIIGPVTQSGVDTITSLNNQAASSGRPNNMAFEIVGANILDAGVGVNTMTSTATGSFAVAYTTLVNNTLLLLASDSNNGGALSPSAPFSTISTGGDIQGISLYGSAAIATPTAVTATTSFTGGSTTEQSWDSVLIPLRPTIALSACPAGFGTGEKIRRQVY